MGKIKDKLFGKKYLTKAEQHRKELPLLGRVKTYFCLIGIGAVLTCKQEQVGIVDDSNAPKITNIDDEIASGSEFTIVHDELTNQLEIRDKAGYKVFSFDINEGADLSQFHNIISKDEYAATHDIHDIEADIIGDRLFKSDIDGKNDNTKTLVEIPEDAEHAFSYVLSGPKQYMSLINCICNNLLCGDEKGYGQAYDMETNTFTYGDIKSVAADVLEGMGVPQEQLDIFLGAQEKEVEHGTEDKKIYLGGNSAVENAKVLPEEALQNCTRLSDGTLVVDNQDEFKKAAKNAARIQNILHFLGNKVDNYKGLSTVLQSDAMVDFIKNSANCKDEETQKALSKLYSFIVMRESGSGNRILKRIDQDIDSKVKAYAKEHDMTTYNGKKITSLDGTELLEMLDEQYMSYFEDSEKEILLRDEGQAKFEKQQEFLYSHAKVSNKEQLTLQAYYDDQVKKHEDKSEELLDEAIKAEDLKKELQIKILYQEFAKAIDKSKRLEAIAKENQAVIEGSMKYTTSIANLINADRETIAMLDEIETEYLNEDGKGLEEESESSDAMAEQQEEQEDDSDIKIYIPEREREENQVKISASAFYEADTDNLDNLTNDVPEIGKQVNYGEQEQEDEEENTIGGIDTSDFYEM